jgi:hypothetical protein
MVKSSHYGIASRSFSLDSGCWRLSSPTAVSVIDVSADGTVSISDMGWGRLRHATNVTNVPTTPSSTIAQGSSAPKRTNEHRFAGSAFELPLIRTVDSTHCMGSRRKQAANTNRLTDQSPNSPAPLHLL